MTNVLQFPDRVSGFVPQRLTEARLARQLARTDVGRAVGMTGQAIGHYENGNRHPDMGTVLELARILGQPVPFFFRALHAGPTNRGVRFFRSVGPKSNKLNMALDARTTWLKEFVQILLEYGIRLPTPNIPVFDDVKADGGFSFAQVDYLAARTRRFWGLGDGPINNMVALLEAKGVIVCRFEIGSIQIGAFSSWIVGRP